MADAVAFGAEHDRQGAGQLGRIQGLARLMVWKCRPARRRRPSV
jgi:hypothetical protein